MSNFLIRGLSMRLRQRIQKFAERRNLSTNQLLIEIINREIEHMEGKADEEEQRAGAFKCMKELREELHRKYGRQEDSTKLIRQMRIKRSRKWA